MARGLEGTMSIRNFARISILSAIALAGAGVANADVFLKVQSLTGDAVQRGFEGQIQLTGATMGVSSWTAPDPSGLGDTVRTTSVSPLFISKSPDRSSPKLTSYAVEGMPLGRVEITFTDNTTQAITSRWIIEGAEVRSISSSPDPMNGGKQTESVEIAYASMTYQYFDPKSKTGRATEEVKFAVPEEQLFPYDQGCH
jgi:type VI protein secretion system component Hcp